MIDHNLVAAGATKSIIMATSASVSNLFAAAPGTRRLDELPALRLAFIAGTDGPSRSGAAVPTRRPPRWSVGPARDVVLTTS